MTHEQAIILIELRIPGSYHNDYHFCFEDDLQFVRMNPGYRFTAPQLRFIAEIEHLIEP